MSSFYDSNREVGLGLGLGLVIVTVMEKCMVNFLCVFVCSGAKKKRKEKEGEKNKRSKWSITLLCFMV